MRRSSRSSWWGVLLVQPVAALVQRPYWLDEDDRAARRLGRDAVYANGFTARDTTEAMRSAVALRHERDRGGRIWIVLSHLHNNEGKAWAESVRTLGLHPRSIVIGPELLWVVE